MAECKRCLLNEEAEKNVIDAINEKIKRLSDDERTDGELYEKRLELCRECDHLISGVCMKCGCYVQLRAAFKNQSCPNVKVRKW
jgi:hypothetical protein